MSSIRHISGETTRRLVEGTKSIPFRDGQIVYGKIEKISENGSAIVKIGNETLIAELQASLREGSKYWFQVSLAADRVNLKLIENLYADSGEITFEQTALQLAKRWELPEKVQPLLRFLLEKQIPVVKEEVIRAAKWLTSTEDAEVNLRAVQMMYINRLPLTHETFLAMKSVQEPAPLAQQLLELKNRLASLPDEKQSEGVRALITQLRRIIDFEKVPFVWLKDRSEQSNKEIFAEAERLDEQIRARRETTPPLFSLRHVDEQNEKHPLTNSILRPGNEMHLDIASTREQIGASLSILNEGKALDAASYKERHPERFQQLGEENIIPVAVAQHMKKIVQSLGLQYEAAIEKAIKTGGNFDLGGLKPLLLLAQREVQDRDLNERIEMLIHRLTGQQLLSHEQEPIQQVFMQLPLRFDSEVTDVVVHWQGRKQKNGEIDPNYCRILFYLQLEALKETALDVRIQNRIIHITLFNETPQLEMLVPLMQPLLKERLEACGYMLSGIKVVAAKNNPKKDVFSHVLTNHSGVDYRI
ncbi:hypothetical protein [Anoxybacteroides tepidamans]|uniref:hypothetical protein n=1 Tax=Anoxybacteroides tepidamans TaxID=265948 RepID=UPI000487FDCA|nr:hypothetical protein [Anoxybacillus tepidamans]